MQGQIPNSPPNNGHPSFLASSRPKMKIPVPVRRTSQGPRSQQPQQQPTDIADNLAALSLSTNGNTSYASSPPSSPASPRVAQSLNGTGDPLLDSALDGFAGLSLSPPTSNPLRRKMNESPDPFMHSLLPKPKSSKYGHESVKTLSLDDSIALAAKAEPIIDPAANDDANNIDNSSSSSSSNAVQPRSRGTGRLKPTANYVYAKKAADLFLGSQFNRMLAGAFEDSDGDHTDDEDADDIEDRERKHPGKGAVLGGDEEDDEEGAQFEIL